MQKIKWNDEDDKKLIELVDKFGSKDWISISNEFNMIGEFKRNRNQLRQRYINFLNIQGHKREFSNIEIIKLFLLYRNYGSDWNKIGECWNKNNNIIKINFYKWWRKFYKFICYELNLKYCNLIST